MEAMFNVHLGVNNWCTPNRRQQIYNVEKVHIHPNYSFLGIFPSEESADVAVLVLETPAHHFRPICLPFKGTFTQYMILLS